MAFSCNFRFNTFSYYFRIYFWNTTFSIDLFDNITTTITEFELFGFPIFGKILGAVQAFGYWSLLDLITVMLLAIIILKFVYKN